jgi:hypothetical protein
MMHWEGFDSCLIHQWVMINKQCGITVGDQTMHT